MKIELSIKKLKSTAKKSAIPFFMQFNIANSLTIKTEPSSPNNGTYTFLQKNTVHIFEDDNLSYMQISIVAESGVVVSQITVFFNKFKQFQMIKLKEEGRDCSPQVIYELHYSCKQIADIQDIPIQLRSNCSLQEQSLQMREQSGKLQILKMGVLIYNFVQRLDPLVYIYNQAMNLLTWKKPYLTVGLGVMLTFFIYNLKLSIFLGSLLMIFGRKLLLRKIQKIHKYNNIKNRIIIPQQNAYFLQCAMQKYNHYYQCTAQFLFNDDKVMLVKCIQLLCKMGVVLIVMLFLLGVQNLVVVVLWGLLLVTSPIRHRLFLHFRPIISYLASQYCKIEEKVTKSISTVIHSNIKVKKEHGVEKQFYYYQYERWWVIKQWTDSQKKYSDEDYESSLVPRKDAPKGWAWIQQWKIDHTGGDQYGYQYSNDFTKQFFDKLTIQTVRRRKWKRVCVRFNQVDKLILGG